MLPVNRIYLSTGIASACRPAGTISVAVAHSHPNNGASDYVLLFKQTRPEPRGQSAGHSYGGRDKHPLKLPSTPYTTLRRDHVRTRILSPAVCGGEGSSSCPGAAGSHEAVRVPWPVWTSCIKITGLYLHNGFMCLRFVLLAKYKGSLFRLTTIGCHFLSASLPY